MFCLVRSLALFSTPITTCTPPWERERARELFMKAGQSCVGYVAMVISVGHYGKVFHMAVTSQ